MRIFDDLVYNAGKKYSIFRNDTKIATVTGLYHDKYSADLPYNCDVQINDIIKSDITGFEFIVTDITKEPTIMGDEIDFIHVEGTKPTAQENQNFIFNVNNAYGSAFGPNSSSIYQCASVDDLYKVISANGAKREDFQELIDTLKTNLNSGNCKPGMLSKFSGIMQKNSWITAPISSLLLNYFMGRI